MHVEMDVTALETIAGAGFETLFRTHFRGLHAYAITIIRDEAAAEDIVQNTFFKLWEKRDMLGDLQSPAAYLYRSVHNESLNFLKHAKVKSAYQQYTVQQMNDKEHTAAQRVGLKELEQRLDKALKELPEQCRTIFQMSRFEELKYREIADRMGLSVKTIENQMGKALKILRAQLVDYLPAALLCLLLQIFN